MEFFISKRLLGSNQHGCLKGKSTQTAIFQFIKRIMEAFEDCELALGIFLDLSKAYDCLDPEILYQKLEHYGIQGNALRWIKSYFYGRTQQVKIRINGSDIKSEERQIKMGIPQGSVAGTVMFLIYINDFGHISLIEDRTEITNVHYVDDTNLLTVQPLWPDLRSITEKIMHYTEEWLENNNLILNKTKTKMILFHPIHSNIENPRKININKQEFKISEHTKFLGIYIDGDMKWKTHIANLEDKIASSLYAFRVTAKYLNPEVTKTVYYAMIESKLRYGLIFYGSGNIQSLFRLQKKAVRLICSLNYNQSCRGFFRQKRILTLYGLYIQECILFIHKNNELFEQYKNLKERYETRTQNYNYPKYRLTTTQQQAEYRCLLLYNHLPNETKNITNYKIFKKKIFSMLMDMEPYCLQDYLGNN